LATTKVGHSLRVWNGYELILPTSPDKSLVNLNIPDLKAEDSSMLYPFGTKLVLHGGMGDRIFRYCKAGGALTGTKTLMINANRIPDATGYTDHGSNFCGALTTAAAVGDTTLTFTDTHDKAADVYAGGYALLFSAGLVFEDWQIISGPPTAKTTPWTGTQITLADPVKYAVAVSGSQLEIWGSPYNNITMPGLSVGYECFMGVPMIPVQSGYYFWMQTAGPVFITPNGWGALCPGYAAYQRIAMGLSGLITTAVYNGVGGPGYQPIGYLLAAGLSGSGDAFINMQLDIG
jgi:hypothetical protein